MADSKEKRAGWTEDVFGSLNYSPPLWMARLRKQARPVLKTGLHDSGEWVKSNQRFLVKITAVCLAIAAAGAGVYRWHQSRPRPTQVAVSIIAPGPTPLKENAKPFPLLMRFSASAARLESVGEPVSQGVTLTPPHRGTWTWTSDRELKFTPAQDWPPGRTFVISLARNFFPEHIVADAYTHEFKSADFTVTIEHAEFNQDPTVPELKRIVATLKFTHPVDPVSLQERIFLQLGGEAQGGFLGLGRRSFPFAVSYDEWKGEAYIHSDRIQIGDKETYMKVSVRAGVRSSRAGEPYGQKVERSVPVPGIYTIFRVENAQLTVVRNAQYVPEQVLILAMTSGVKDTELAQNLAVYLLPKDKPPIQGQPIGRNYYWGNVSEIGPEVLSASQKLELVALPTDREFAATHSYRFKAEPGGFLYIRIKKGVEAFGGYKLANTYDAVERVPQYPKEVKVMHSGSLVSLQGDKRIRILSRGVPAVRFEVSRIRDGQVNHFVSQSHGNFTHPAFYGQFKLDNMSDRFETVTSFADPDPTATNYASLDLGNLLAHSGRPRGLFYLNVQGWDPLHKLPFGPQDNRAVLVTDLGLLVKEELSGSRVVFVQSLQSGKPVADAQVEVLGLNGEPIAYGASGGDGRVSFQPLNGYHREKQPIAIVARKGDDLSFIPIHRADRYLDMSRFDTGGVGSHSLQEGLHAYLFSDRGIYQPGDEFRIGLIVKGTDWLRNLGGVPLEASLTDARGLEVHKERFRLSEAAFENFKYKTEETSPTGAWTFSVHIVKDGQRRGLLDSVPVRVEEFLPDRLRIETRFSVGPVQGWVSPKGLNGLLTLKNLYGTPASGNAVGGKITLAPTRPQFSAFKDYVFADPTQDASPLEEMLPPGSADDNGEASFEFNLRRFERAVYRLRFYAEGFEAGGGHSVASESSILVSDRDYLLGVNPGGRLDYMHRDSTKTVHLIAVGPDLVPVSAPDLSLHIFERSHVSALKRQPDGTFRYESVVKEILVSSSPIAVGPTGLDAALYTVKPAEYRVSIRRESGREELEFTYCVVGDANVTRSLEKAAQLQLRLAKTDYAPGDEIELQFNAPYAGAGLMTIERERVYTHRWFSSGQTFGIQKIRIPQGLEGNGYVNVAFVRASNSPEIYMKPLSYAAAPFTVSRDQRMIPVDIDIQEEARPGDSYKIRYKTDRKARIIVFAVDEGILQVAAYQTPAPLNKFLAKRALEVRTAQILDLILPDYSSIPGLKAPGGDGFSLIGKNLNPFKRRRAVPVAYWSGVLDSGEEWREVEYPVPDHFNGTLRVMAVAVSADAIGVGEAKGLIRAPFVITPQVPLFMAPGDRAKLSASVLNNQKGSGPEASVNLRLALDKRLRIVGTQETLLTIPEGKERKSLFEVEALHELGGSEISFFASREGVSSRARIGLSVRPPVPYRTTVQSGNIARGKVEVNVPRRMYPDFRELTGAVSTLPLALAHGLSQYLKKYPFGCTEQLVSRALAALVLRKRPGFGYETKEAERSVENAIKVLRARQNQEGAFGFWAANSHVSPFQAIYAMHFLTELKDQGQPLGTDIMRRAQSYLDRLGARDPQSLPEARDSAYALYILTRNGQIRTRGVEALHQRLKNGGFKGWEDDLTAAYLAASYAQLRMHDQAGFLMSRMELGQNRETDYANYYDPLRRDSQLLYLWANHFPARLKMLDVAQLQTMADSIAQGSYNTITSAYAILAFDAYAARVGQPTDQGVQIDETLGDKGVVAMPLTRGIHPAFRFSEKASKLSFKNPGPQPVFYQATQAGFDLKPPVKPVQEKLEVHRELRNAGGENTSQATLGEVLTVVVRIRSLGGGTHSNIAVVDLLASGFEPIRNPENPAYDGARLSVSGSSWRPEHEDIREDRVILFGPIGEQVQEYRYTIRAVNAGTFHLPPAYAESMYDRSVQARSLGGSLNVK